MLEKIYGSRITIPLKVERPSSSRQMSLSEDFKPNAPLSVVMRRIPRFF
jgi:hypothetical protein